MVPSEVVRQKLQGYKSVELSVFGLIDHTHTSATEFFDNAVVRDSLTDERVGTWHDAAHVRLRARSK